jgi:hypothetical protein
MLSEIEEFTVNDKERLVAAIHWAIAEKEKFITITLDSYRTGTELIIGDYDYKEIYDQISAR